MTGDLDRVLPRQRPAPEPHGVAARRRRAQRADDFARLAVAVLALLSFVGITALAVAGAPQGWVLSLLSWLS